MSILTAVAFTCLILLPVYLLINHQIASLPLPPGPKGKPIIGNLSDLPPPDTPEWQHWLEHKKRYGSHLHHHNHQEALTINPPPQAQ